jgi:ElaB/YqjD/DUF883 family membrane-anchored ribosome-binding protein
MSQNRSGSGDSPNSTTGTGGSTSGAGGAGSAAGGSASGGSTSGGSSSSMAGGSGGGGQMTRTGGGSGGGSGQGTAAAAGTQAYTERITGAASQAKEYVSDKMSVVGDKLKDLQNTDYREVAENAKQYAKQNPGQALLISAAAGFLLGILLRGGRR